MECSGFQAPHIFTCECLFEADKMDQRHSYLSAVSTDTIIVS